jgi:hypothetical protein
MKCFKHAQTEAVGTCKYCSKGMCSECADDTGFGIACSPQCKEEVLAIKAMMERNKKAYPMVSKTYMRNTVLLALFAAVFIAFGLAERDSSFLFWFFLVFGFVMLLGAIFSFVSARKYAKAS